jgi:catechol 2,3-dioxygenase-like lactoylglutathione lyase family enzyme
MKMHLNLATRDLDASVAFYRTLLVAEPTKHYADYALFLTDQPDLELALDRDPETNVREGAHYGIVVEDSGDVDAAIARLKAAGYPVDVENEETCCYAVQNKVWATDPDGRRWETYFVLAETEERDNDQTTCCTTHHPRAASDSGSDGYRAAPRRDCRVRDHGPTTGRRKRRAGLTCKHAGNRRRARRHPSGVRADLGRAFESRRHDRRGLATRPRLA